MLLGGIISMAQKLVEYYDFAYAKDLADKIKYTNTSFDHEKFLKIVASRLGSETFLARQDIYVDAFEQTMESDYGKNLEIFKAIWGDELIHETGMFKYGWWLWPIGRYVERHGCKEPGISYEFIKEFTKRQTGEYAIRPLLIMHTEMTMKQMLEWSIDENVHVRRLSSEGMRINLPWAKKTAIALDYFEIFKKVLTNLKDDSSKFVQKSVGNNLNDLYKYEKELADQIISKWSKEELSKPALWVVKHGQRSNKRTKTSN